MENDVTKFGTHLRVSGFADPDVFIDNIVPHGLP